MPDARSCRLNQVSALCNLPEDKTARSDPEDLMFRQGVLLLLLIGACLPDVALGQISPFRGTRGSPLNADDVSALTEATNRLLDRQGLTAGAKESWSNPKSGAGGTVTAGNAVRQKGLACRVMQYDYTVPGPRSERNGKLTWCKTHDGWKVGS